MPVLIVESTHKAKALAGFLDSGWKLFPTYGHFMEYSGETRISSGSFDTVWRVRSGYGKIRDAIASFKGQRVYIASDPDPEGELIAYHVSRIVGERNAVRVRLHAITPSELRRALSSPGEIHLGQVKGAMLRTACDYHIGKMLSEKVGAPTGRLQVAMLYLVANRISSMSRLGLVCKGDIRGTMSCGSLSDVLRRSGIRVVHTGQRSVVVRPVAPLTTARLIGYAGKLFGFMPQKTMQIAQKLYATGWITYPRTDSVWISPEGFRLAEEFVIRDFGREAYHPSVYDSEPGHHECIRPLLRPTPENTQTLKDDEKQLLNLIYAFFVASQMPASDVTLLRCEAVVDDYEFEFLKAPFYGTVLPFTVLLNQHPEYNLVSDSGAIPSSVDISYFSGDNRDGFPHSIYSLVMEMGECGVGRPSTYAYGVDRVILNQYISTNRPSLPVNLTDRGRDVLDKAISFYPFLSSMRWQADYERIITQMTYVSDESGEHGSDDRLIRFYEYVHNIMEEPGKEEEYRRQWLKTETDTYTPQLREPSLVRGEDMDRGEHLIHRTVREAEFRRDTTTTNLMMTRR